MRFVFSDIDRPAGAARQLLGILNARGTGTTLTACQEAVARGCGWKDWRELKWAIARLRSTPLDEPGSNVHEERVAGLASGIRNLGVHGAVALGAARELRLTVARRIPADEPAPPPAIQSPEGALRALPDLARSLGIELTAGTRAGLEAMAVEMGRMRARAEDLGMDWDAVVDKARREAALLPKTPKLALLPPAPPGEVAVWVLEWEESERGWGCRPDGYSVHASKADCRNFVAAYWAGMPDRVNGEAPDEYSRPRRDEPTRLVVPADHGFALSLAAGRNRLWDWEGGGEAGLRREVARIGAGHRDLPDAGTTPVRPMSL